MNSTTIGMTDLNGRKEVSVIVVLDLRARNLMIWLAQYGRNGLVIYFEQVHILCPEPNSLH